MLRTRRFWAATLAATVAALTAVTVGPVPAASADPIDPGCSIATCPTDPPSSDPTEPPIGPVFDDPEAGSCRVLGLPVDPLDLVGLVPPAAVPGAWAYQLCGEPATLAGIPTAVLGDPKEIRSYCEKRACGIHPIWKPTNPNQAFELPLPDDPSGFGRFFQIWPKAVSVPVNGDAVTNFPTWFYDRTNPWGVIPVPIPPVALIGFGGGGATAIHLRSWWEVDGETVCDNPGRKPGRLTAEQALEEQDCGAVFTETGKHTAVARETWLIIIVSLFPPAIIPFNITLSDNVDNLHAREVQAAN